MIKVNLFASRNTRHRVEPFLFIWSALLLCCTLTDSSGQGTMTINFQSGPGVPPPGYRYAEASYNESGMQFSNPYGQENLVLAGGGVSGYPENGTGYLQVSLGAKLSFSLTPVGLFNFVSFDAAGYGTSYPGETLEVVGFKPGIMSPPTTVTNYFTVASVSDRRSGSLPDFETFHLDSQFNGVYRVDVLTALWSLDNLVTSGVPEPSTGTLLALGALLAVGYRRARRRQAGD